MRKTLVARHKSLKKNGIAFDRAAAILEAARGRVDGWRLDVGRKGDAWDALAPGLKKIYSDGRDDLKTARDSGDAELWHDWRKRAKDLRYALELLRESAPAILGGMIDAAGTLGDDLGDDHDLAVLLATVRGDPDLCDDATAATLEALATRRSDDAADIRPTATRGGCTPSRRGRWSGGCGRIGGRHATDRPERRKVSRRPDPAP